MKHTIRLAAAFSAAAIGLAACANDAGQPGDEVTDGTADPGGGAEAVAATGVDYAFEGIPSEVAAGTTFTFANASETEFHEMVVVRVPEQFEELSLDELLALPEEETADIEPEFVFVAMPGEDGLNVFNETPEGTVSEPGRYLVACFIPTGADPEMVSQFMQDASAQGGEEGPPDFGADVGPPHFTQGMATEFTVN